MRLFMATAVVFLGIGLSAASAQTYSGAPLTPPELQQKVIEAVASRLTGAGEARIRDLKLSKARSGHGYCGFVADGDGAAFEPFHVLLDEEDKAAVLILPEQGDPPGLSRAQARQLLVNFGCAD